MPDDLEDDLDLLEEDDPEPLPVIRSDGTPEAPAKPKRRRARNAPPPKRANARVEDLAAERQRNLEEARSGGRLVDPSGDEWREILRSGNRNRASNRLADDELTHNSGSGFGLA